MSLDWVGAEGLNVIDFQGQIGSEEYNYCSKVWPYCVNNPTECTFVGICNNCVQFLPSSVKGCCQQNPPASCFQGIFEGTSGSQDEEQQSLSAVPAGSASITDANAAVCATALAAVSACEVATSGFDNLDATAQASCLCYDTANSYVPSVFDGAWSSCAAYASTADTSDYPAITSALGLCQSVGDVRNGGGAATATDESSPGNTAGAGTAAMTGTMMPTDGSSGMTATGSAGQSSGSAASGSASSSSSTGGSVAAVKTPDIRLSGLLVVSMLSFAFFL